MKRNYLAAKVLLSRIQRLYQGPFQRLGRHWDDDSRTTPPKRTGLNTITDVAWRILAPFSAAERME
ncbi:MAG: hypothetical protein ACYSW7_00375 [Planctomycetota bacterium]